MNKEEAKKQIDADAASINGVKLITACRAKEIIKVNIDTTHGDVDVYIDGKPVAPRQNPKRYVLPMPDGTDDDDPDDSHYAVVNREYHAGPAWHQGPCISFKEAREHYSVTQSDIDAAPAWVKAIKPFEATDDDE